MSELYHIFIFLIILFLYIHITSQYKRSEDLEIYEMDYTTNTHLQEVCDVKQPVLFNHEANFPEFFDEITIDSLALSGINDVKLKESSDYFIESDETIDYVVLSMQSSLQLINADTKSAYFIENNEEFISDSKVYSSFQKNDEMLKPSFVAQTKYDLLMGSKNTVMPLRYHTYYRKFICVTSGKISIKMTPWKSHKYLYPIKDYDNYDFRSPINVWNTQQKYKQEMDKIKFLEFDVNKGNILYIPPYWWYSIKFSSETSIICEFNYSSIMNCISNIPNYLLYFMQQQNTKTHSAKILKQEPEVIIEDENDEQIPNIKSELEESIDIIRGKP